MPYGAYGMTVEQKASAIAELRDRCAALGRDPDRLEIADTLPSLEGSIPRTLQQAPALARAGVTIIRLPLRRFVGDPGQVPGTITEIVNRFAEYRRM